jgi:hypothetical protein
MDDKRRTFSFVMHGLDPCIQGRRLGIINNGAAWTPGSRPGMTRRGGAARGARR